jgi:hypothetical protein
LDKSFAPLLALQDIQQRAMFSALMIRASLTMCSQEDISPLALGDKTKETLQ